MISANYNKISSPEFVYKEGSKLIFDFKSVDFLSVFDITELFFHCCSSFFDISGYEIKNDNEASSYLERVNFFYSLGIAKNFDLPFESNYTGGSNRLLELQAYTLKLNFYKNKEKILEMFKSLGLSDTTASLLSGSLYEIVDNSFSHNIGLWRDDIGPLTTCLIQKYQNKQELCISICDFGVGFLSTLKDNYPELENEEQAIDCALKAETTSRNPQKGGNGLFYLQGNIFNGFQGTLAIRSANTFVQVTERETIKVIENNLPFSLGANIFFTIKY